MKRDIQDFLSRPYRPEHKESTPVVGKCYAVRWNSAICSALRIAEVEKSVITRVEYISVPCGRAPFFLDASLVDGIRGWVPITATRWGKLTEATRGTEPMYDQVCRWLEGKKEVTV